MKSTSCQICGLSYMAQLPEDRSNHRRIHSGFIRCLSPKSSKKIRNFVNPTDHMLRVDPTSGLWRHKEIFWRARCFKMEFQYDFTQWQLPPSVDWAARGFLFADDTGTFGAGALVGACAFRWQEWADAPHSWSLRWVWLAPKVRRKGILSRKWPYFRERFGDFHIEQPLSDAMSAFLQARDAKFDPAS